MLRVNDYHVAYGQSEVLHGLDFALEDNEILAVMGRNGMGKSTLMQALMGVIPSRSGSVTLGGTDINGLKSHQRVAAGLGFVPQGRWIFPALTVEENILTGLAVSGRKQVPETIYALFPVLKDMRRRRGGNLSGGQQQQLAIARALATNPKVLLLDEPTEGIQPSIIREMARVLRRIRDEHGLAIVVSEQVVSFALDVADRLLVLENGRIVHEDRREDVDEEKIAGYLTV